MGYQIINKDGYTLIRNDDGVQITTATGKVIEADGLAFRDLEGDGVLHPCDDYRLPYEERAHDMAGRLSVQEMIGLTVHVGYQPLPAMPGQMEEVGTYDGKTYPETSGVDPWALTDQQKKAVNEEGIRHFTYGNIPNVETAVRWLNTMQSQAENQRHSIPVMMSSDPRHGAGGEKVEFRSAATDTSQWPSGEALAALRDPATAKEYAQAVAKEYRALGITTALGPQIDLHSEPRWFRGRDTFGADVDLTTAYAKAACEGLQTTEGSKTGWGKESVIAMAKHWPGGGTGEGGRDAHYPFGKYAVYPGGNFETHLKPFVEGAFALDGGTESAAAVMPYYTVSWNADPKGRGNVGNNFSEYIIKELLLGKYHYKGVVCTDFGVHIKPTPHVGMFVLGGKCHGVEELTEAERVLRMLTVGVNQFGGMAHRESVDEAYALGCEKYGSDVMDTILRSGAEKILLNMFRVGIFDDPYLDLEESRKTVGNAELVKAGMAAQKRSPVLLKNRNAVLPLKKGTSVWIPDRHVNAKYNFVRMIDAEQNYNPISDQELAPYYKRAASPEEADAALVFITAPSNRNGYEFNMMDRNPQSDAGYYPISLQYRPYTAELARETSIAGGDPREQSTNRSYRGRTETTANERDLDNVLEARQRMGDKPVIVVIAMDRPAVPAEFEPSSDAIVADFSVSREALFAVLSGEVPFTGKLPVILPANMETVETHCEDVPDDIQPYVDSEGNVYNIGYGL